MPTRRVPPVRVRGVDLTGAVFTAAVLCAADPTRTILPTPISWAVVTVGTFAVLAVAAWQRAIVRPPRLVGQLYLAFLGWLALAAATGEDGRFAWLGIPERHAGWVLWLVCGALLVSGVKWKAVADGMVVAGLVWLPVLLFDALGHPWLPTATERLTGLFGSAAYLGAAACLVAPAALGVAFDVRRTHRWRWAAAVAATSAVFAAAGSGSRAAWVGLGIVGLGAAWLQRRRRWLPRAALALAAVVALAALTSPVGSRVSSVTGSSAGGASRIDEWRVGLATLGHHPLLGAGPEGYRIVFHDGVDAEYEREHGRAVQPDRAHNGFLDLALAGGVPAALLYGAFITACVMDVRRRTRGTASTPAFLGVLAAIAAYLVQQQFLFPLAEMEPVLFLLAGGVVCSAAPTVRASGTGGRATAAAATLIAAAALWWGVSDIAARSDATSASTALAAGNPAEAYRGARDALDWRDDEVWLHLLAARTAPTAELALAHVDDALALSPRDPIALRNRQELLVTLDPATAFEELHDLLADDPSNASLQQLYGTAAIRTGDEVIAEQAWLTALDLAPNASGPRQNLITLYRQQGRDAEADELELQAQEIFGNP